jgi:hypothetical protein
MAPYALALVGCGRAKRSYRCPARYLYASSLFRLSLAYAEAHAPRVWIVSAMHGLVHPDAHLSPYNYELAQMHADSRAVWAPHIVASLGPSEGRRVLLLAAGLYARLLGTSLRLEGWEVEEPLAGLTLFERNTWLAARKPARAA